MRCTPTCFDTCRLQKACLQMLLSYEGGIRLCLPKDQLNAQLSLCSLKVDRLCILPDECCSQTVRIALKLSCCVSDPSGCKSIRESEIRFAIPQSGMQAKHSRFDAAIYLIHSCRAAHDSFHICAQIRLTQMLDPCDASHCRAQSCFSGLPLYPQIRTTASRLEASGKAQFEDNSF